MEHCSTCATILPGPPSVVDEKPLPQDRAVECCGRIICGRCIHNNRRFASYCPYCQVSTAPSPLPQGLKDPPSYTPVPSTSSQPSDAPPPYTPTAAGAGAGAKPTKQPVEKSVQSDAEKSPAEDTLHFLDHDHDSIGSLSLRYGVPAAALRAANGIASDHLLLGRRTAVIPGAFYSGGVSLSPRPVEGEDEERRKARVRRFMTACKVADYDVATLYLEQAGYDLAAATRAYLDDEAWERDHPKDMGGAAKAKRAGKNRGPFWRGL